jgi:hypothetical protein
MAGRASSSLAPLVSSDACGLIRFRQCLGGLAQQRRQGTPGFTELAAVPPHHKELSHE